MLEEWQKKAMFEVSEQRLADQVKQIKDKNWLSQVEIEELKRSILNINVFPTNEIIEEEREVLEETEGFNIHDEDINEEEQSILNRVKQVMQETDRVRLPALKGGKQKKDTN